MGKFPAPFLMNTVHFAMQAILSKFITWFWSHRFQTSAVMSWSDYFLRGKISTLLSHVNWVFQSRNFFTSCLKVQTSTNSKYTHFSPKVPNNVIITGQLLLN